MRPMFGWKAIVLRSGLALIFCACAPSRVLAEDRPDSTTTDATREGVGWAMTSLDLDVTIVPGKRRLEIEGEAHLRLEGLPASYGPNLLLNTLLTEPGDPVMTFAKVAAAGAKVTIPKRPRPDDLMEARLRYPEPKPRGSEVRVRFRAVSHGGASQLVVTPTIALASWTAGWHPFTNATAEAELSFSAGTCAVPGRTTLHLPAGWVGLLDGERIERHADAKGTLEVWSTPEGIARSFAAGRYEVSEEPVGDRVIRVHLLPGAAVDRSQLARLIAGAMAAEAEKFGPFPFPSYGVVEVPEDTPGQTWYAASQQTFIMAKSHAFQYEHGNLPLWAHEMGHAWWGNIVGSRGEASKWCDESLAQLGAYVAIEAIEGPEALHDFLRFSRTGYSPVQCAAGYFSLVRQGQDLPLATMGQAPSSHSLSDSKGSWIYHMLRSEVGDDRFYATLRGIVRDYAHREIGADSMRQRFVDAAPDRDLRRFFAQWLDRKGAPVLDVDWYATPDGKELVLDVKQTQEGPPFAFDLDLEISLRGGGTSRQTVSVADSTHRFRLSTPSRPVGILLDPDCKVLLWRPEYGPRPNGPDAMTAQTPPEIRDAIVGRYRFRAIGRNVEVFLRDGALYLQPAGSAAFRLHYQGEGIFRSEVGSDTILQEFDLSKKPCPRFISYESGREYVADRVASP